MSGLDGFRSKIDAIDTHSIALLADRARLVEQVGEQKRADGTPIYAPHRERAVLDAVRKRNPGPLSDHTIEAIWRELMSGSFALEQGLQIACLGPPGSFSHLAATRHFGSSVTMLETEDIDGVFRAVASGAAHYGMVPWENSIIGSITDTLDAFVEYEVDACAETLIEVTHCLMGNCDLESAHTVASKPQILSQCRRWIDRHLPHANRLPMSSSAAAAEHAASNHGTVAIGARLAARIHGLNVLAENIGDSVTNITRFLVLGRQRPQATGSDRTSIMFITQHTPGALVDVLAAFRDSGINLSHIDKRPSGRVNWQYTFYIDADSHRDDDAMKAALSNAEPHCVLLRVLGSYPQADAVL